MFFAAETGRRRIKKLNSRSTSANGVVNYDDHQQNDLSNMV